VRPRRAASPAAVHPDSPDAAYTAAIKKLARQPQSRAALAHKLERQGYTLDAVGVALDRAQADGYLDDRAYAESLVRRRSSSRGASSKACFSAGSSRSTRAATTSVRE